MQQQNAIVAMLAGVTRSGAAFFSLLRRTYGQIFVRGSEAQQAAVTTAMVGGIILVILAGQTWQATNQNASLTSEQVNASIRIATAAAPGRVLKAEAQNNHGTTYCNVKIDGIDGKTHDITVNVVSNRIVAPEYVLKAASLHTTHPNMAQSVMLSWPTP